ncbi:hypothetical protein SAMN05421797_107122 [Maribacter ulvicola]|uniref:Uncharacterized protein n=1 Tax=Maribacter ulvicola TaxID=228959 RepID=A0A1N6YSS0_9FLAO|nr:hypothetical protein SAMN05421797_107122 [Maribacter ulvicola]
MQRNKEHELCITKEIKITKTGDFVLNIKDLVLITIKNENNTSHRYHRR